MAEELEHDKKFQEDDFTPVNPSVHGVDEPCTYKI